VTLAAAVAAALAAGIGATALSALLARVRRIAYPRRWFLAISIVVLLLSFVSPLAAAEQTSTALWLSGMHVTVAAALVPSLARALPERSR